MKQPEIDALVHAHRGRGRPVAFLHVLRQTILDERDHAFLEAQAKELTAADLLRWRARTQPASRAPILVALAEMAKCSPAQFEHEVLNAPGIRFDEREWETLADLTRGKTPQALFGRIERRETGAPAAEVSLFAQNDEGPVDLAAMFDLDEGSSPAKDSGSEGSLFGGGDLGDALGLDLDEGDGDALFADPFAGLSVEQALEKVRSSPNGDERAMLLDWLEKNGQKPETSMATALEDLEKWPVSGAIVGWIGKRLTSAEAWKTHGQTFLGKLVGRRAFAELQDLLAQTAGLSEEVAEAAKAALGHALIDEARRAIAAKNEAVAAAALSALSCLDATPDTKRRFGGLKQAVNRAGGSKTLSTLVDYNVRLSREKARSGPLEGLVTAVHALSDALGTAA